VVRTASNLLADYINFTQQYIPEDNSGPLFLWEFPSSLMMEAVRTSETSVDNYFTQHYIPEDNSGPLFLWECQCVNKGTCLLSRAVTGMVRPAQL
jgi:hypothetical protein